MQKKRSEARGLRISTLGDLHVSWGQERLSFFGIGKLSALFVYLAIEQGAKHSREKLAELLWPDMAIEAGRTNLRHTFFQLRNALMDQTGLDTVLLSGREWLGLAPDAPLWIDAIELDRTASRPEMDDDSDMERMVCLAGLYRGEFMAGFRLSNGMEFENWLSTKRDKFHRQVLSLLERLSNHHERIGNFPDAIRFALRLVDLDPWNEAGYARAIRLYALDRQYAAALSLYDSCIRVMETEIGVAPTKDTRRLAESIREGRFSAPAAADCGCNCAPAAAAPLKDIWLAPARRQVTVLHCELSSFATEHPDDIDLALDRIRDPLSKALALVQSAGGHAIPFNKSEFSAYFGYTEPSEHATLDAIRVGLSIAGDIVNGVDCRIGIHVGWIVTGDNPAVPDPVGFTSRIAMKLSSFGEPGKVILSEDARGLVPTSFVFASRGRRQLESMSRPLDVFAVGQETPPRNRLEAGGALAPFIGRQEQIALLSAMWQEVEKGARHTVVLHGDPGIGKSRLALEFVKTGRIPASAIYHLRCLPEYRQSPFRVLTALIEDGCGYCADDTARTKLAKWESFYSTISASITPATAALLAEFFAPCIWKAGDARERLLLGEEDNIASCLLDLLRSLIKPSQACLLLIDNEQWIDPASKKVLIQHLNNLGQQARDGVLTLMTSRNSRGWPELGEEPTILTLPAFSERETAMLVNALEPELPAALTQRIVERADGIALFAEELVRANRINCRLPMPPTLHDLLAAQMSIPGKAKRVAQIAATIGREFTLEMLRAISPLERHELTSSIGKLLEGGLIQETSPGHFKFRYGLLHEMVYHSLPLAERARFAMANDHSAQMAKAAK